MPELKLNQIVTVIATVPQGALALQLVYRTPDGAIKERLIGLSDKDQISLAGGFQNAVYLSCNRLPARCRYGCVRGKSRRHSWRLIESAPTHSGSTLPTVSPSRFFSNRLKTTHASACSSAEKTATEPRACAISHRSTATYVAHGWRYFPAMRRTRTENWRIHASELLHARVHGQKMRSITKRKRILPFHAR